MKIALIDVNYSSGSTGKIVESLRNSLVERGFDVRVYFGRGEDPQLIGVYKFSTKLEVIIHAFLSRVTGLMDYFSPIATFRLIKSLRAFEPDIVHLHDLHGYFLNISNLMFFLKKSDIPTLWTFHCEYMYTGRCGYSLDCSRWKTECYKCPSLKSYPRSWFFDFSKKMFRQKKLLFSNFKSLYLATPSHWLLERMKESMVSKLPMSIIPNGIDMKVFHPQDFHRLKEQLGIRNEYVVLSVGSNIFSEIKGGHWVLEIAKRNLERNIIFIIVGADEVPQEVSRNVIIKKSIRDQSLLATYYSLADVLILPSKKETFSMVCAESLACGTPIIGFDSGAPREVAPENFGVFVPYPEVNALNDLLLNVISGKVLLESKSRCVEFAHSRYSNEIMVDSYIKEYYKVLG
jgi:glycosyltransferase involved in cell wall biosynthesis